MTDDAGLPEEQREKVEELKNKPVERLRHIIDHYQDLVKIKDDIDEAAFNLQDTGFDEMPAQEQVEAWEDLWEAEQEVRHRRNQFESIWRPLYEDRYGMDFIDLIEEVEEHGADHVVEHHLQDDGDGS